ncbi:MAG: hypothetical protein KC464_06960, partial [Myxococcales bacterium]|nr:hypothetical protein [Myxococcales bacterium]
PVGAQVASRTSSKASVDHARAALRFVVTGGTITADGLEVVTEAGDARTVAWRELASVAARRMPPDPPFARTLLVDLVPTTGSPLRLLASTRLDYRRLPGGAAPSSRENLRRLVTLALAHNGQLEIDAASADFFAGTGEPPTLGSLRLFAEYDARYG